MLSFFTNENRQKEVYESTRTNRRKTKKIEKRTNKKEDENRKVYPGKKQVEIIVLAVTAMAMEVRCV